MQALIDGDVLVYQASFVGQMKMTNGGVYIYPFEKVSDYLEMLVDNIQKAVGATKPPILFLTHDKGILEAYNRESRWQEKEELGFSPEKGLISQLNFSTPKVDDYHPNFREWMAVTQPYKDTRGERPYHYKNTKAYILAKYDTIIFQGVEADDALGMCQNYMTDTVICSRDKDLKINPGYFYGWPAGNQAEQEMFLIPPEGFLQYEDGKMRGGGMKFFYAQMIMGDSVDNIPGVPRKGASAAYKLLKDIDDPNDMEKAVKEYYIEHLGGNCQRYFLEQARLLWMVREHDNEGRLLDYKGRPFGVDMKPPITFWRKDG